MAPISTSTTAQNSANERATARLVAHVRRLAAVSRRVSSVRTGASVPAAAGLLDGKRAATHWIAAEQLAAAHPAITVDPDPIHGGARAGPTGSDSYRREPGR
ncbi:hypothetical protein [Nocardia amikacinitolerans]|uniref:hypothetical protein n=1 Tax=Nocardia amikacinitolerans TaxID=756689 RepID=UPI0027E22DCD|nr:hypothetical protein [Nocardia amikacinitolerans]MCP2279334.1 putative amidotransferase [Nocardia amikacinitolerans]